MARKIKFQKLESRRYVLIVCQSHQADDGRAYWYVRDRQSCADAPVSFAMDDYNSLKRVWRRSKEDFESACRFMEVNNLFSQAGVQL